MTLLEQQVDQCMRTEALEAARSAFDGPGEPFVPFPKIPRLNGAGGVVVTEKIDGTNALVHVSNSGVVRAGSRTRWIFPESDNFGFAKWVNQHPELVELGPGYHYGEWWGSGIQRTYGCPPGEKHFSLFDTKRWHNDNPPPACCRVVPVLGCCFWDGVADLVEQLREGGSIAMPGYRNPEGVVVFHFASRSSFKVIISGEAGKKAVG